MTSPATIRPRGILIHRSEAGHTGEEVRAHEAKAGLGYHYFVRKDGTVDQLYPDTELVWHARNYSRYMLGIAVYGDFTWGTKSVNAKLTPAQVKAATLLCVSLWKKYGPLPIYGHTDLPNATHDVGKVCPGPGIDIPTLAKTVFLALDWTKIPRPNVGTV